MNGTIRFEFDTMRRFEFDTMRRSVASAVTRNGFRSALGTNFDLERRIEARAVE